MHLNGWTLADVVFLGAAVAFCWYHRKTPRLMSTSFGLAAGLAVFAIPPWRDALAGVFSSGPGMVILVIGTFAGLGSYFIHWLRIHHPVWSTALAAVGGTFGAMAWGMLPELGARGVQLAPHTAAAMGQATAQIRSGQAAAAQTSSERAGIIVIAVLVFIALIIAAHKDHQRKRFKAARNPITAIASGRPPALPSGGQPIGPSQGRKSLLGRK